MLLLSDLFIIRSEVTVESVIIREEVRGCGVRVIQQSIVHVFVVRADPLPQPHLLDPLSVLLPRTLLSRPRLLLFTRGSFNFETNISYQRPADFACTVRN